ncbi:hypothetical protein N7462_006457 [Penicillium macrosclerotiorum]|uniref:uncharacterized protein n=1 Tax=Penicillium macrosclerotiorum TaxID=303699 RepID=UPI00254883D7|nr:uncharacterized protein N7462_006457 [Penicillium macrosclerotiorum]KAJ5683292.1 hypothetical protein N7462_006457 [Penicillium macrosclerotiorum]
MLAESNGSPYAGGDAPKLRTACENCRQSKVKCNLSGKNVCTRCLRHGLQCQYGFANRSGKPKGSKNRATLRKLGQLQEEKPSIRGFRGSRLVPPAPGREPLMAYPAHLSESMEDEDVCLIPGPLGLWDSPRTFGGTALDTPICPSQLNTMDGPPFPDLLDSYPALPGGLGCPHTPVTPTFLASDSLADGLGSPSFGSVSSPYTVAPCECVDMQLFHMNRLNHLLADSMPLRFDHSLQILKTTFCACQVFMSCSKCTKDSANLLLLISVINLTLQLFEYWISRETTRPSRAEQGGEIRYGYYEICQEENRHIRPFLLRGLLLQCREVLSSLTAAGTGDSNISAEEPATQPWHLSDQLGMGPLSDLDPGTLASSPDNNYLLSIIAGYEATVIAFLQSISANDCVCGSKYAARDN